MFGPRFVILCLLFSGSSIEDEYQKLKQFICPYTVLVAIKFQIDWNEIHSLAREEANTALNYNPTIGKSGGGC